MNIKETIQKCVRILAISRKPTSDEFAKVAKITALGVVGIGLIGIIISFLLTRI